MAIPIYLLKPSNDIWKTLKLVLNVKNTTNNIIPVTSGDIEILEIESGNKIKTETVSKIFPPDPITNDHILIAYLDSANSSMKTFNSLNLEATFSIVDPTINALYNSVSTVTFSNKIDTEKQELAWGKYATNLSEDCNIVNEKENWRLLHGQRHFKENSFDFSIKTIGFRSNKEILLNACDKLISKIQNLKQGRNFEIQKDNVSNIPNAFNIKLINESYTIGNILKKKTYDKYYPKIANFVGFYMEHPHDNFSVLKIGFDKPNDPSSVISYINVIYDEIVVDLNAIKSLFNENL